MLEVSILIVKKEFSKSDLCRVFRFPYRAELYRVEGNIAFHPDPDGSLIRALRSLGNSGLEDIREFCHTIFGVDLFKTSNDSIVTTNFDKESISHYYVKVENGCRLRVTFRWCPSTAELSEICVSLEGERSVQHESL